MALLWMLAISVHLGNPPSIREAIMPGGFQIFLPIRIYWGALKIPMSSPRPIQLCRWGTQALTFVYNWPSNSSHSHIREPGI